MAGGGRLGIIGSLPVELVVGKVEYLDQADIARCQRVQDYRFLEAQSD